jgi:hypothetical protein
MNKKISLSTLLLVLGLLISGISYSQSISYVENPSNGVCTFDITGLTQTTRVSHFSHLWWFGDNGFSFDSIPSHRFYSPGIYDVCAITTENYGGGGPPPPPAYVSVAPAPSGNGHPNVLGDNEYLFVQNYRNAVPGDTLYLIVSYKNPHPNYTGSGELRLSMDPSLEVLESVLNNPRNESFHPNGESYNGDNSWEISNMTNSNERTILIPVQVNETDSTNFNFQMELWLDSLNSAEFIGGESNSWFAQTDMDVVVAKSHDPNMVVEKSNAKNDCEYGGKKINYTIHFENIGEGATKKVFVVSHLDTNLDLSTIRNFKFPWQYRSNVSINANSSHTAHANASGIHYKIDYDAYEIRFEFFGLPLLSPKDLGKDSLYMTRSSISFDIDVNHGYSFGPQIETFATIIFDDNEEIVTNVAYTSCENSTVQPGNNQNPVATPNTTSDWFVASFKCCWIWIVISCILLILLIICFMRKRKK